MRNLKKLFDYQKFEGNSRLSAMIDSTESKYLKSGRQSLSDEDLFMLNAAGSKDLMGRKNKDDEDGAF